MSRRAVNAPFSPPRASLGEHYDALRDRIDKIVCTGAEWWYLLRQADGLPPAADLVRQTLDEAMPWRFVDYWQMTHDVAWRSVEEQAHRARRYDRGGHCAADTRDTPRAGGV